MKFRRITMFTIILLGLLFLIIPPNLRHVTDNCLNYDKNFTIVLNIDGVKKEVNTYAKTVDNFFKENNIEVKKHDIVIPSLKSKIDNIDEITLLRVRKNLLTKKVKIETTEKRIPTKELYLGEERIVNEGSDGLAEKTFLVTTLSNNVILHEEIKNFILETPVERVIEFGIKDDIIINGKEIKIKKVYNVKATAYTKYFACTGKNPGDPYFGITASGLPVEIGHIAVDKKLIDLHTKVYIQGKDDVSSKYNGFYTATDTGGAIKGKRIDVYMEDIDEMNYFGVRYMKVFILEDQKKDY